MDGRVLPINFKKEVKSEQKKFEVHFKVSKKASVIVTAGCFQPIDSDSYYFFTESSKEVGRAMAMATTLPEPIAMFGRRDVSHIVLVGVMAGNVPVRAIIEHEKEMIALINED